MQRDYTQRQKKPLSIIKEKSQRKLTVQTSSPALSSSLPTPAIRIDEATASSPTGRYCR